MKATELRIGNLFIEKYSGQIIKVIGLNEKTITFEGKFKNEWQAEPIPLTEEWLLKFGFEKKYDDFNWYIKGNYCFSFLKELDLIVFKIKFQTVGICTIKYVHQAQNLYFALTGEELTL